MNEPTKGDKGVRGAQGVQGVQGIKGAPGEDSEGTGSDGSQGVQGIQGVQGVQGEEGQRGHSARPDDIPRWVLMILRLMLPAYLILTLAVVVAFYVGLRFAADESERICAAMERTTNVQVDALINASNAQPPDPPRTPAQEKARDAAIDQYRADVDAGLALCPSGEG